jgi:predicted SnoaL-like aldol condensation-catalyzing enzyme
VILLNAFLPKERFSRSMIVNRFLLHGVLVAALLGSSLARAQIPVTPATDQLSLLQSSDPALAANKRLVFDFWREVLEGGHLDLADKYLAEGYIQHNPMVPTGRAGFVSFFSKFAKPHDIAPTIQAPLITIVAEKDLVILSFVRERAEPKDPTQKYTTTGFDMFRLEGGKIVEHWDTAVKQ